MRAIAILVLVAGLVAARSAAAEPPAKKASKAVEKAEPEKAQPEKAQPEKAQPEKAGAARGFGLGSMAAQAAGAAAGPAAGDTRPGAVEARRLDLSPRRQLETGKAGQGQSRLGAERTSGLTLGDDGDWRVHAAQVGAMAAAFGALVALCGNGGCMLPDFLGAREELGPPPGLEIREEPELRDPR